MDIKLQMSARHDYDNIYNRQMVSNWEMWSDIGKFSRYFYVFWTVYRCGMVQVKNYNVRCKTLEDDDNSNHDHVPVFIGGLRKEKKTSIYKSQEFIFGHLKYLQ